MSVDTDNQSAPTCPHCGHALTDDEMHAGGEDGADLWALAPNEGRTAVECPNVLCGITYHVQGSYAPLYTSARDEDDLP
jgi:hypothetical protein